MIYRKKWRILWSSYNSTTSGLKSAVQAGAFGGQVFLENRSVNKLAYWVKIWLEAHQCRAVR